MASFTTGAGGSKLLSNVATNDVVANHVRVAFDEPVPEFTVPNITVKNNSNVGP